MYQHLTMHRILQLRTSKASILKIINWCKILSLITVTQGNKITSHLIKLLMHISVKFRQMVLNVWVASQCLSYTTSITLTSTHSLRGSLHNESQKTCTKRWIGNLFMTCLPNQQEKVSLAGNLQRGQIHLLRVKLRNLKRRQVLCIGRILTEAQKNTQSMSRYMVEITNLICIQMNTSIKMEHQ